MKNLLLLVFFLTVSISFGQKKNNDQKTPELVIIQEKEVNHGEIITTEEPREITEAKDPNYIYPPSSVEITPQYSEGLEIFHGEFKNKFKTETKEPLKGRIILKFVVEKDGSLSDFKVIRDLGHDTGKDAIKTIKTMKKWKPAKQSGKNVRCMFILPVHVDLNTDETK
ncbi:energy transducer TonB [Flavobacterium amniphilum]|uniref:energy transducer TonB n=1 Tax=Flavobacterium amniphilum TaxID=1834035 RepID=UPI002029FFBD|nr:energy transducer TonB [Flavobacterium amniphilum]MCL9805650.1 energy transducer TonB [Flavobacterium amniphilum]